MTNVEMILKLMEPELDNIQLAKLKKCARHNLKNIKKRPTK